MQLFRQYDAFDGPSFLGFLKKVHRRFGKQYLFLDRANQHKKTKIVTDYMKRNRKTLRVRWFPTASPEFDMMEECWREGGGEGPLGAPSLPYEPQGLEGVPCEVLQDKEVPPGHEELPPDEQVLLMKLCRPG